MRCHAARLQHHAHEGEAIAAAAQRDEQPVVPDKHPAATASQQRSVSAAAAHSQCVAARLWEG
eukprot:5577189-Prymnesium_polylepis.1